MEISPDNGCCGRAVSEDGVVASIVVRGDAVPVFMFSDYVFDPARTHARKKPASGLANAG
jgi:hypothetical protein